MRKPLIPAIAYKLVRVSFWPSVFITLGWYIGDRVLKSPVPIYALMPYGVAIFSVIQLAVRLTRILLSSAAFCWTWFGIGAVAFVLGFYMVLLQIHPLIGILSVAAGAIIAAHAIIVARSEGLLVRLHSWIGA